MTNFFIKKRLAREWNAERNANFISYADSRHIVVLAEAADIDRLRDIACQWQKENKDVTWVIYTTSALSATLPGRIIPIHQRLGGLLSFPTVQETELFDAVKPDTLIDISQGKHIALQFLAAHSKAPMKIGVIETAQQNPPFDLIVRRNESPGAEILLQEIILYWNKIDSKDAPTIKRNEQSTDL